MMTSVAVLAAGVWTQASSGQIPTKAIALLVGFVALLGIVQTASRRWQRRDISLSPASWGKVYILQDVETPALLKVGLTGRTA